MVDPAPVLVFFKSATCGHCKHMIPHWKNLVNLIRSNNLNVRTYDVETPDMSGRFDYNVHPKAIGKFARWFPMIFLVDGKIWDKAVKNRGPASTVDFEEQHVSIMNGVFREGSISVDKPMKYEYKAESIYSWLVKSLQELSSKSVDKDNKDSNKDINKKNKPPIVTQLAPGSKTGTGSTIIGNGGDTKLFKLMQRPPRRKPQN